MAIDSMLWPVKAADRALVALLAQFTGNGTGAPGSVRGRGVSVTRTGVGTYEVTFPTTLTKAQFRGLQLALLQAAGTKYELQAALTEGGGLALTVKSGGAGFTAAHLKAAADSNAGDATAETPLGVAEEAATVTAVSYLPGDALTAHADNYATLLVSKRAAGGGSKTTVASVTTQIAGSGDWTAWAPVDIPVTSGALTAGQGLTFEIAKAGSGVVVPAGKLVVTAVPAAVDLASTETVIIGGLVQDAR